MAVPIRRCRKESKRRFEPHYRTTILSAETDPNNLNDLKADLDRYQVYDDSATDQLVELFLGGAHRDKVDPILDACVTAYADDLGEDGEVDFKGKRKLRAFSVTYNPPTT